MRAGPVSPVAAVLSESWGTGGPGRQLGQVIPLATHPGLGHPILVPPLLIIRALFNVSGFVDMTAIERWQCI
ncbi:hypothetical protein DPEC_G00237580 [Dallia pectoralis]|uniref:Uncharacterized protein n=1 Tax=Dallia pectoralis TaxID=75939 RepID=A0ACC2FYG1_DALPE|nr:hypothetical protein DPEC_G00237580 [Dallia pectoralis]